MKRSALLALSLAAAPLAAQAPPSLGTAAGLGAAGVTEARRTDAILWNPALVGIYDGPVKSFSLLGLDFRSLSGGDSFETASRLGVLGANLEESARFRQFGDVLPGGGGGGTVGQVVWFGAQARDLALSVSTHYSEAGDVPFALRSAFTGEEIGNGTGAELLDVERSTATVLSVAKGAYLGRYPGLGQVWAGVTAKGWYVHDFGIGTFAQGLSDGEVYSEASVEGVPGFGIDFGIAGRVADRVRYGVAVANLYQQTFDPREGARERVILVARDDAGRPLVEERFGPEIGESDPDVAAARRVNALWKRAAFPSVLRAGLAYEAGSAGVFAGAVRSDLLASGLDAGWSEAPVSVAWSGPTNLPLRLSYGWGEGVSALNAGVVFGRCDRRWAVAAGRRSGELGSALQLSASLTFADWGCRLRG